jgi:iron complex transport system substrate-binding protein
LLLRLGGLPRPLAAAAFLVLSTPAWAGCDSSRPVEAGSTAISVVDDAGREVSLARPARRIVSLVPSATEALFALGAGPYVIGRTRYDTAPEVRHLPSVGGGLDPSLETLVALRPELVIGWEEHKSRGLRERLERLGIPLFAVSVRDTGHVFSTISRLGVLVGRDTAAMQLNRSIRGELAEVAASVAGLARPSVLFVVWNDPPMTTGPGTFIAQLVEIAGGTILFPDLPRDWSAVSMEEVVHREPDVVVLPVGGNRAYTREGLARQPGWRELEAVRRGRMVEVPTDLMTRPGPHIGAAAREMRRAIHPDAGVRDG